MLISWYSNSPRTPTGYGTQTAQVCRRLKADGHDVEVLSNYGNAGWTDEWEGITVHPSGIHPYSLDVAPFQHAMHLGGQPGWLIGLYDVWVMLQGSADPWGDFPSVWWTPIDHDPVPPEVLRWARSHRTIAMSRHGQRALAENGVDATYIPHALEQVFRPTESDIRERIGVPGDAFLVMVNAANNGLTPPRKAWVQMLAGFSLFVRGDARLGIPPHPDAYLYLHTQLVRPNGVDIPYWAQMLSLDPERLKAVGQGPYRAGMFGQEDLAKLYTAADVLLATSMGEGFGIPVIESMACGTPAIVTDFSAQPELVGDTGWKVAYQPEPNYTMGSFLATPSIPQVAKALDESYRERGTRREAVIAKAAEYDADRVYAEHWRPLLAQLERDLDARPARKGMSRGSQKRARRAA